MPYPVKLFGGISAGAAVAVFLAPALIILAAPPLIFGILFYRRRLRGLKQVLHDQRWSDMASYHLVNDNSTASNSDSIPYVAKSRIQAAIGENEQGLGDAIAQDPANVKYTPVESLYQDFKGSQAGFQETLQIRQYGLLDPRGKRLATVNILLIGENQEQKMRVEVTPKRGPKRGETITLQGREQDVVIDI